MPHFWAGLNMLWLPHGAFGPGLKGRVTQNQACSQGHRLGRWLAVTRTNCPVRSSVAGYADSESVVCSSCCCCDGCLDTKCCADVAPCLGALAAKTDPPWCPPCIGSLVLCPLSVFRMILLGRGRGTQIKI